MSEEPLPPGFKEATKQIKSCSRAARNILPGLESADGVDLRDIDDGSQGFQSGAAALANLSRQSVNVKPSTGRSEHCNPFPKTAPACPKHWEVLVPPMRLMLAAARQHTSPQRRRNPSELPSKSRLKPVWTSTHFPHLPLKVSLAFRAALRDRGTDPPSHTPHVSTGTTELLSQQL